MEPVQKTTKQQEASYDERYTNVKPISSGVASKEEQEDEEYEIIEVLNNMDKEDEGEEINLEKFIQNYL